jgi:replicative DNA helicase
MLVKKLIILEKLEKIMAKGILVVSLEMPAAQIIDRLVANLGQIPLRVLSEGVKTQQHMQGMAKALNIISNSNLVIRDDLYDTASIVATARAMAKSPIGLKVLMVDYIQLVRCDIGKEGTREREVAEVSRALRLLALETGCLVLAITQLNEQGKSRESKSIQMDATCVLHIQLTKDEASEQRQISIPYQRNGPCGVSTQLRFNGRTASFLNE